jgi:hypothetical protein
MADISSFKNAMRMGGARSNQFKCTITIPGLKDATVTQAIPFTCHAASIPEATVMDIETYFRGRAVHFAGERVFQPWTVSIYNDNDFKVRNAFEDWVERISHGRDTNGLMQPATYQTDMSVHQMDRSDKVVKSYKFYDAYPTNVGGIQLSWADNNQIQSYDVQFVYNYWMPDSV